MSPATPALISEPPRGLWRQVARAWRRHVAHPVPRAQPAFADRPWRTLLALLSMATPLALLVAILVAPFGEEVGLRSRLAFRFSFVEAVAVLLIAPCVEELVFRGPLGSRRAFERAFVWLPLAAAGVVAWIFVVRHLPGVPARIGAMAVLVAALSAAGLWLDDALERRRFTRVDAGRTLFARRFTLVAHLSTLAFALSHASNYALSWSALWFVPLAVLPQLVLGYAALFARATLGLRAAMMLHAAHNVIAYSLAGLAGLAR